MRKFKISKAVIILVLCIISMMCLLPFLMVVSGSLSSEADIQKYGYTLIPRNITILSYRILLLDMTRVINAYEVSIFVTVVGTLLSVIVNTMMGYAMSRRTVRYRNVLAAYALITMLFSGGLVPWYIMCVNILHLNNTLLALLLPPMAGAFNMFLVRNYMLSIPEEIYESAKIDGAGEMRIFWQIMAPLATPVVATITLFIGLGYWNDWFLGLMFVDKTKLQPLQLMLRIIVSNQDFVRNSPNVGEMRRLAMLLPSEGIKMAVCVITIGPIVLLYPLLQKHFVKGIMIGAVKG